MLTRLNKVENLELLHNLLCVNFSNPLRVFARTRAQL